MVGLFGSPHPRRRAVKCDFPTVCNACGSREIKDFPAIVYARLQIVPDVGDPQDISLPLYRYLSYLQENETLCDTEYHYQQVQYHSDLITLSAEPLNDDDNCCFSISLWGTCALEDPPVCNWEFSVQFGHVGCQDEIDPEFADDSAIEGEHGFDMGAGDNCFDRGGTEEHTIDITFSETAGGGDAPEPCDKLCCPSMPDTVYVTLESDCPALDGRVITARRYGASCLQGNGGPAPNARGIENIWWRGDIDLCECGKKITVLVGSNTWSTTSPRCNLGLTIGGGDCLTGGDFELDTELCPPITVGPFPWWPDEEEPEKGCGACCEDLWPFDVTATITG